jgi:hypothetical protein
LPSAGVALLALVLRRPPTDTGVWLTAPPTAGTTVVAPLDLTGEAQAPEGVLTVSLYLVRGTTLTPVASYVPTLPVGTVPFTLRWDPAGTAPGRVTLRVVASTLVRGFSADVTGLVVPAPRVPDRRPPAPDLVAPPAAPAVAALPSRSRGTYAAPRLDDSGRSFGAVAGVLPYAPRAVAAIPGMPAAPARVTPVTAPLAAGVPERRGWVSVALGLLLLLACSHLHRVLRTPRSTV